MSVILLLAVSVRLLVLEPTVVQGDSMLDTLRTGDIVLVLRIGEPGRGDIVRCGFPGRAGSYLKRLIGLPGETLSCRDGALYVDGTRLEEPYVTSATGPFEVTLGEDEYFVMGDNRAESYDSREPDMGPIPRSLIYGRVIWTLLPISRCGPEAGSREYTKYLKEGDPEMDEEKKLDTNTERQTEEISQEQTGEIRSEQPEQPEKPTLKQRFWKEVREWVVSLAVALAVVLVLRSCLFTIIRVDGSSMYSTLKDGERLFVTVFDAKWGTVERGDIVICHYPNRTNKLLGLITVDTDFVKRVVGVPGDSVERHNGVTTVTHPDGSQDVLDAGNHIYTSSPDYDPYTLADGEYFVVGDNRGNSHDSRDWKDNDPSRDVGPITRDMIVGHVRNVIWPLSEARSVE